jgi:hypothetical protein
MHQSLSPLLSHLSPPATGRAVLTRACACDGMAGGGLARTPSRAAPEPTHLGASLLEDFPLLPLPVTQKRQRRPLVASHVAISARAPNPVAPWLLCPCVALTERIYPRNERPLLASHQPAWGFSLFFVLPPQGWRGGVEEEWRMEEGKPCAVSPPTCHF